MRQLIVLLTAILTGCAATNPLLPATNAGDTQFLHTESGIPYHWEDPAFPIQVKVDRTMPATYAVRVEKAVEVWNNLVGYEFLSFSTSSTSSREEGVIFIQEAELGPVYWEGKTEIRTLGLANTRADVVSGRIRSSVILLDVDIPNDLLLTVAIHEIGHALGLQHDTNDPKSTMFPLIWDPLVQAVTRSDIEAINAQLPDGLPIHAADICLPWPDPPSN